MATRVCDRARLMNLPEWEAGKFALADYPGDMDRRVGDGGLPGLMGAFVASSAVMGLLGAGLLMPVAGIGGATAKSVVTAFDALPAQFTSSPMAQQSRILAKDGSVIATLYTENRLVVPIDKIAPVMQDAQVAIEDRRFYEHGGIDGRGLMRALASTAGGGQVQGASTLTQQYVKQLLIATARQNGNEEAATAAQARGGIPGVVRKIQEMKYAISMEQRRNKKQILEGYLNIVYYGAQAYGVEAAARRYFNTTAAELTLPQAAMIAGLAQNPGAADPIHNPKKALSRRNDVLKAMRDQGMISTARMKQAQKSGLGLDVQVLKPSCPAATNTYVCDYVVKWLEDQPALGKTPEERRKRIYYGGLNIHTTFDPGLTKYTTQVLKSRVSPTNAARRGTAAAVVEPGTGRVLAIGQNTDWALEGGPGKTSLNWAVDTKYGASAGFQIGSTAKMFSVVTALEEGMSATSSFYAPKDGTAMPPSAFKGEKCGITDGPTWRPFNAEGEEHGNTTLHEATVKSINTAFAELATRIGVCEIQDTMKKMGLARADGEYYGKGGIAATVLGADNASPVTLAASYATLAAGGVYCEPRPVESVEAFDGTKLPIGENKCRRAVDPEVAYKTTQILEDVVTSGTGKGAAIGRPVAGKTGTADNSSETWFAGYTPQLAAAVWYGSPYDNRSVHAYGGTVAAPLFSKVMTKASKGLKPRGFKLISGTTGSGKSDAPKVDVPDVTGRREQSATRRLEQAGFKVETETVTSTDVGRGRVVETSPAAGESAAEGSTITLRISDGGNG